MPVIPGFQSYVDYVGIKRHFNDDKSIWQFNANYTRLKPSSFEKRKDQAFFIRLERSHRDRLHWVENLISGFLFSPNLWIGQIFEDDIVNYHTARMTNLAGLESLFMRDCEKLQFHLFDHCVDLNGLLLTSSSKDPIIISLYLKKEVSLETLVILHHFTQWVESWSPVNPLQKERRFQIYKYRYLLDLSDKNYGKIEEAYQQLAQPRVIAHSALN